MTAATSRRCHSITVEFFDKHPCVVVQTQRALKGEVGAGIRSHEPGSSALSSSFTIFVLKFNALAV